MRGGKRKDKGNEEGRGKERRKWKRRAQRLGAWAPREVIWP
jgi:hypothetical protein